MGGCVRGSALLLLLLTFSWTGAMDPPSAPAPLVLQENVTLQFSCRSEGRPPPLTWDLSGKRQPAGGRAEVVSVALDHGGRLALRPRLWNRELACVAADPRTGERYNATITLSLQVKPETLRLEANGSGGPAPGLALALFALVQAHPPATISLVDQSGRTVANTSDFLLLDAQASPWLANQTLRIMLSSQSGNINVTNGPANLTLAEFLQSRVEVPMLGIVTGGSMAFMALLILSLIVLCLMQKNKTKAFDQPVEIVMTKKSNSVGGGGASHLPRDHMSLPANVQLNDLSTLSEAAQQKPGGAEEEKDEEEDLSSIYAARGFARYPMVGYIYKVNSTSSEEIWL